MKTTVNNTLYYKCSAAAALQTLIALAIAWYYAQTHPTGSFFVAAPCFAAGLLGLLSVAFLVAGKTEGKKKVQPNAEVSANEHEPRLKSHSQA